MLLSFNVAGVTFENRQQTIVDLFSRGKKYRGRLEREPDNPEDPYAVKVYVGDHHIGYVPQEVSEDVSELIPHVLKTTVEFGYSDRLETYFAECRLMFRTEEDEE